MKRIAVVALAASTASACVYAYPHRRPYVPPHYIGREIPYAPNPSGRWDDVMRLPQSAVIDVLTADGTARTGSFRRADLHTLWIALADRVSEVPRSEIVRIDFVDGPGAKAGAVIRRGALGAVLGLAGAAVVSAALGGEAWPPPGALLRSGAAVGAYSHGQAELARRQSRIIYLAPQFRP